VSVESEYKRLDDMLEGFMAARVTEDADALLAARVAIGSASARERLRYYLGLGASRQEHELVAWSNESRRLTEEAYQKAIEDVKSKAPEAVTEVRKLSNLSGDAAQPEPDLLESLTWRINEQVPQLPELPPDWKWRFNATYVDGVLTLNATPEPVIYFAEEEESV
jgi:hypothetical protein